MYQMVQDKVCGVLNDYDLSVIHDKSRQVGDERTPPPQYSSGPGVLPA